MVALIPALTLFLLGSLAEPTHPFLVLFIPACGVASSAGFLLPASVNRCATSIFLPLGVPSVLALLAITGPPLILIVWSPIIAGIGGGCGFVYLVQKSRFDVTSSANVRWSNAQVLCIISCIAELFSRSVLHEYYSPEFTYLLIISAILSLAIFQWPVISTAAITVIACVIIQFDVWGQYPLLLLFIRAISTAGVCEVMRYALAQNWVRYPAPSKASQRS